MSDRRAGWRRATPANGRRVLSRTRSEMADKTTATIFLVMRRMRAPLITLIVLFTISVIGFTVIPGVDSDGNPARMTVFDSFYFMSYTATTIGFGELPWAFTTGQRMWATVTIYLSVIGWAYAVGSLLTLLQDRAFRQVMALQRFTRKVARLSEPFLLLVGYGRAGELLVKAFDTLGQRVVVIDSVAERIDALELGAYRADVPGLAADATNPHYLGIAGIDHPQCSGVLVLTDDDETNLSVTMTVALLRPELRVVSRATSARVAVRMSEFGSPTVVNPFDRFGAHLRLALCAPASYRLLTWLEEGPGAALPPLGHPPPDGRWVMCGYGRFGRRLTADLRDADMDVTIIEAVASPDDDGADVVVGDAADPAVLDRAGIDAAVGFVAGTDDDTANLAMLAVARRLNPRLFLLARQNRPNSSALFEAMHADALLVPSEVVAHEVYAHISSPLLARFIRGISKQPDEWAAELVERLVQVCGQTLPALWKFALEPGQAPALAGPLERGEVTLGGLLRHPEDRERRLNAVPLLLLRSGVVVLTPDDGVELASGDELLFAGPGYERRELETTLIDDSVAAYVLFDKRIPSSLIWRKLAERRARN